MCSFKKGDILLESKPFATILTKENVDKRCEVCFCEFEFLDKEKAECHISVTSHICDGGI